MANECDVLERKPTEIDLADVAKVSGGNWKRLLTYLGVPHDKTVTFLGNSSQNVHDACFEGLLYWRKGNAVVDGGPSPVTYSKLLQSMQDAEMKSTAEEMRKKIVKQYKPVVNTLQPSPGGEPSSNVIHDERSKKWSESGSKSNVILKKAISDVEGLLGQSSDSVEDLQDKMRILVEEWSKISEHEVSQEQFSALKGTLCKDHLGTIEKAVEGYQKVGAFLEDSGLLEGKLSLSIDLCQLAVEKKAEVDWMLEVLQTKQKELESDEHLYSILKGKKHKAVLKAASEKKKSEINLIKDDTDIKLSSSDSEEVPRKRSLQLSGGGTTECEDKLFALACEDGVKDKYMCHVYEKTESHWTRPMDSSLSTFMYSTAQLRMVITYSTSHWSQIVQKYCKPDGKDWKLRTVIQDFTVEGDVITPHMPESSGPNWSCTIDGIDKVPTSSLDFTKRFPPEKDGPKSLEQAVKSSFYPPKINLMASSNVHGLHEHNRSRFIYLEIAGSSPGFQIPVQIVQRVEPGMDKDFSFSSMKTPMHLSPTVQKSGMTETSLKTKAATILLASSKEKDQQAN